MDQYYAAVPTLHLLWVTDVCLFLLRVPCSLKNSMHATKKGCCTASAYAAFVAGNDHTGSPWGKSVRPVGSVTNAHSSGRNLCCGGCGGGCWGCSRQPQWRPRRPMVQRARWGCSGCSRQAPWRPRRPMVERARWTWVGNVRPTEAWQRALAARLPQQSCHNATAAKTATLPWCLVGGVSDWKAPPVRLPCALRCYVSPESRVVEEEEEDGEEEGEEDDREDPLEPRLEPSASPSPAAAAAVTAAASRASSVLTSPGGWN